MLLACALLMLGIAVMAWALFWDRARGRRRCPKCQYDMSGIAGLRCPECGREQRSEKKFHRTRRRWRWAAGGLVLVLVSLGVGALSTSENGRWAHYAPTWLLVRIVDPRTLATTWSRGDPVSRELRSRMESHGLTESQSQVLVDRIFELDPVQCDNLVRTRTRWPAGVPVAISGVPELSVFSGTPLGMQDRLRVRLLSTADGSPGPWADLSGSYHPATDIGVPKPGTGKMTVEVELRSGLDIVWHGVRELRTNIAGDPGDCLTSVSTPDIDARFGEWLKPSVETHSRWIVVSLSCLGREQVFSHYVALGLRLTLFYKGHLVATGSFSYTPPIGSLWRDTFPREFARLEPVSGIPPGFTNDGWELEVVGDRDLALRDYDQFGWATLTGLTSSSSAAPPPWSEPTDYWSGKVRVRASVGPPAPNLILDGMPDLPFR
jgi:hypothetical protein